MRRLVGRGQPRMGSGYAARVGRREGSHRRARKRQREHTASHQRAGLRGHASRRASGYPTYATPRADVRSKMSVCTHTWERRSRPPDETARFTRTPNDFAPRWVAGGGTKGRSPRHEPIPWRPPRSPTLTF
eukprot:5115698-Prymnesium_polylepis.1